MILYDEQGTAIRADKCQRPRSLRNNRGGRTWDSISVYIDDMVFEVWFDSTWGWYGYFRDAHHWYKARLDDEAEWKKSPRKGMQPEFRKRYTTTKGATK